MYRPCKALKPDRVSHGSTLSAHLCIDNQLQQARNINKSTFCSPIRILVVHTQPTRSRVHKLSKKDGVATTWCALKVHRISSTRHGHRFRLVSTKVFPSYILHFALGLSAHQSMVRSPLKVGFSLSSEMTVPTENVQEQRRVPEMPILLQRSHVNHAWLRLLGSQRHEEVHLASTKYVPVPADLMFQVEHVPTL